jgi:hypothetical protein
LNDLGACIPEYGDGLNGPIFEKRINGEITTSLKSVVSVGGHRKERRRDTLLRQVGSPANGKMEIFSKWSSINIAFVYHKRPERLLGADT